MKTIYKIDWKKLLVTILRMSIGWHFLFEGVIKLLASNWTSHNYLVNTSGFLSFFYHWLASSPVLLKAVDLLNMYGLVLIGLGLFIGLFSRLASVAGVFLLSLYYFAYPPMGLGSFGTGEGHLFIVDKIFIEGVALLFIIFYAEKGYGIDTLYKSIIKPLRKFASTEADQTEYSSSRREVMKNLSTLPFLGIMGLWAYKATSKYDIDVWSGATITLNQAGLGQLTGELPKGKINKHPLSRLILGGNIIAGGLHARDLLYSGPLSRAYNTEKKIFETIILAEKAGINSINIGYGFIPVLMKYKKVTGSKIIVITQVRPDMKKSDYYSQINKAMDSGMDIIQINGGATDILIRDRYFDVIVKMIDRIRSQGYTAGLGAHHAESLILVEENGIVPDYYMKTMHHDRYWSANNRETRVPFYEDTMGAIPDYHDNYCNNMWDQFPERTNEFIKNTKVPVVGFKVLAAGAIHPKDGFKYAFVNGADFICVGMFDFQIVNDINICLSTLKDLNGREREWFG